MRRSPSARASRTVCDSEQKSGAGFLAGAAVPRPYQLPSRNPLCGSAVLIVVERSDVIAVVAAAMRTHGVEHHAQMLGFDLTQTITHTLQQAAAVGSGADDCHHAVHSWSEGDRF